jgi:hypothetical protein
MGTLAYRAGGVMDRLMSIEKLEGLLLAAPKGTLGESITKQCIEVMRENERLRHALNYMCTELEREGFTEEELPDLKMGRDALRNKDSEHG